MNKLIIILPLFFLFTIPSLVSAQNKQGQMVRTMTLSPTGSQAQKQNLIETQNQGEDSQLEVKLEDQANTENGVGEGLNNRNQNTLENMSPVAQQVQQLLQIRTVGGIGEQVRQVASEQNQAQNQIQLELNKLKTKSNLAKKLFGPDYKAVKNLNQQIQANQLRIQQLEQLANQVQNQADAAQIQAAVQALIQQNTSLLSQVQTEERLSSWLGWLVKLIIPSN